MARSPAAWHPEDIKAELRKRHGSLRRLSMSWGYRITAVSQVLRDPRYSRPLEQKIASALGVKPHVLWPDRWTADGSALPRDGDHSSITTNSQNTCKKAEAA